MAAQPEALRVAALHGPNLNLLGQREPSLYGSHTLAEVNRALAELGAELGVQVVAFQSNAEGELVDYVQRQAAEVHGFVVNAAGYTHTSVALRDALLAADRPFVEVHLSNVFAREPFRHHSYLADRAVGVVAGLGVDSYLGGLRGLVAYLRRAGAPGT